MPRAFSTETDVVSVIGRFVADWNMHDAEAAFALFSDDARTASSSGMHWIGKTGMREFLAEMWDPTQSGDPGGVETLGQCIVGDRVAWTFRYADAGVGTADVTVSTDHITHVFWSFTPADGSAASSGGAGGGAGPPRLVWELDSTSILSVGSVGLACVAIGLSIVRRWLRRRRRTEVDWRPRQRGRLLRALRQTSATRLRSSSESTGASLALTGATTPCAPASTQKRTQRSSDRSSTSPCASKGVTGIVKTPRH